MLGHTLVYIYWLGESNLGDLLVARPEFAEGEENSIHDSEGTHVLRLGKLFVRTGHDEPDHSLEGHAKGKCVSGTDPVTDKGTKEGSG